ncbi:MAG: hypothetical protein AAF530_09565 [Pseudomonadota bacterium]
MKTVAAVPSAVECLELRPPGQVMRLARIGSFFPSRLSFMRRLIRRMNQEAWQISAARFDLDDEGYGVAVYEANTGPRVYSLICYSQHLPPERRSDRVIAEEWDATFTLFDGRPNQADIDRLATNVPKQEAGRCSARELVLSRANKSVRLFAHVVDALAQGRQPDVDALAQVGYLMRTTAVYGNGKFGLADREKIRQRPEMAGPFAAEMLAVYLIRCFTLDLVNHVARQKNPDTAVPLEANLQRFLGIGNSTGLGMAPFLVTHPILINNWIAARETALARVRKVSQISSNDLIHFFELIERAQHHVSEWNVDDERQQSRILKLREELPELARQAKAMTAAHPVGGLWDRLFRWAEMSLSLEAQELLVSLLVELYPELVDDLAEKMGAGDVPPLATTMTLARLNELIETQFSWAMSTDFGDPKRSQRFWYVSEEKLEPRLGDRLAEPGAEKEMALAISRSIQELRRVLDDSDPADSVAHLLLARPDLRLAVRRVQTAACCPYSEVQDNLIDETMLPIDLLRCKLSFFGASKFDPRSDRWTRITLYQGAPLSHELVRPEADDWAFPVQPRGY